MKTTKLSGEKKNLILIIIISFLFFALLQFSSPNLLGADAFYHLKMTQLIKSQGIMQQFPWLQFTTWNKNFVDHHLLFHILLVPFTTKLIFGGKIIIALFGSIFIGFLYWLLKKYKIKWAFWWSLLLLVSSNLFLFRISLIRAPVVALFFLILGLYFAFKNKYVSLFILSTLFAWLYGGFIFLPFIVLIYVFANWVVNKKNNLKAFILTISGCILGLTINPYFPKNINFLYTQIFKAGAMGQGLRVGGEWFPTSFQNLFFSSLPLFIFFFLSTLLLAIRWIKLARQARKTNNWGKINVEMFSQQKLITITLTLLILSLLFLTLTLNSQRFVEYWAPFTLLYSAFATHLALRDKNVSWPKIKRFLLTHKPLAPALVLFFCVAIIYSGFLNVLGVTSQIKQTQPYDAYKQAAQWLEKNTSQNSIVFHSDWDNFPMLFFWNHHNYYIIGMDPTFMYVYDQGKYWLWENITQKGIACDGPLQDSILTDKYSLKESKIIHDIIIQDFNSRYVFIDDHHEKFKKRLEKAPELFEKTYEDEYASVYELK